MPNAAPQEVLDLLAKNIALAEDDLRRGEDANTRMPDAVSKVDINALQRAVNNEKIRLAWAEAGVPT